MNILFLLLLLIASTAQAKQIVLDIPDTEIQIVESDVPDAEEWIRNAWAMKLHKSTSRLAQAETKTRLDNAKETGASALIPADENTLAELALQRSDYKNRKQRDQIKE